MLIFGLTGGIGSGKSTVSNAFKKRGAQVIDADALYHSLIEPLGGAPSALATRINEAFPGVLTTSGGIDRKKLGALVFSDEIARKQLGAITHPAVAQAFGEQIAELEKAGADVVLYDVPLLFERKLQDSMHGTIVVWVPAVVQLQRLMARDGFSEADARARIQSQMPLDQKRTMATWVVDNSGPLDETERQVEKLWQTLTAMAKA